MKPVLVVLSSAGKLLDGQPTGWYLPEAAHPYYELKKGGIPIVIASTNGGTPPVDQHSVDTFKDEDCIRFLSQDEEAVNAWKNTASIHHLDPEDYSAVFIVGGHGPMIDLAFDDKFAQFSEEMYNSGKVLAAVCHGPAGYVQVKNRKTGKSIFDGIQATGFSNSEEAGTPYNDFVNTLPFSLEKRLQELGGTFVQAPNWNSKVVYDGRVLTGQNPYSGRDIGIKLREILLA